MYAPFPPEPSAASQIQAGAELLGGRIATDSSGCILRMVAFLEPQKLMRRVTAFRHSFRSSLNLVLELGNRGFFGRGVIRSTKSIWNP